MRKRSAMITCILCVCLGALGLAQDPADGLHRGIQQIRAGQLDEAKASLDRAIEVLKGAQRPNDLSLAYAYKAMLLLGEKREGDARECLSQAMAVNRKLRLSSLLFPPELLSLYRSIGGQVMEGKMSESDQGAPKSETLKLHTTRSKKPIVFAGLFAMSAPLAAIMIKDAGSTSDSGSASGMQSDADGDGFSAIDGDCLDSDRSTNPNGKVEADFSKLVSGSTSCVISSGADVIEIVNHSCSFQSIIVRFESCYVNESSCSMPNVQWRTIASGSSWSYSVRSGNHECYSSTPSTGFRSREDVITIASGTGTLTFRRSISYDRSQCPKC